MRRAGSSLSAKELLDFYAGKVAKWWVPDDVVFVPELPLTATGKLQKLVLRQRFGQHRSAESLGSVGASHVLHLPFQGFSGLVRQGAAG